jgi:hypothetical protein
VWCGAKRRETVAPSWRRGYLKRLGAAQSKMILLAKEKFGILNQKKWHNQK